VKPIAAIEYRTTRQTAVCTLSSSRLENRFVNLYRTTWCGITRVIRFSLCTSFRVSSCATHRRPHERSRQNACSDGLTYNGFVEISLTTRHVADGTCDWFVVDFISTHSTAIHQPDTKTHADDSNPVQTVNRSWAIHARWRSASFAFHSHVGGNLLRLERSLHIVSTLAASTSCACPRSQYKTWYKTKINRLTWWHLENIESDYSPYRSIIRCSSRRIDMWEFEKPVDYVWLVT